MKTNFTRSIPFHPFPTGNSCGAAPVSETMGQVSWTRTIEEKLIASRNCWTLERMSQADLSWAQLIRNLVWKISVKVKFPPEGRFRSARIQRLCVVGCCGMF